MVFVLVILLGLVSTFAEAFVVMLLEGALASSMAYAIPTLSYESSVWLTLMFSALVAAGTATSRIGSD